MILLVFGSSPDAAAKGEIMDEDNAKVREDTVEESANDARETLKKIEARLRASLNCSVYRGEQAYMGQHSEMKAQTMLAVRHIEDARMRCGKILQYADDGVSILDKK